MQLKIFSPGNFWNKKNIFFFKWVNKIFWVAAISVGWSKRGNKQDFILSPACLLHNITCLNYVMLVASLVKQASDSMPTQPSQNV